MTDFIFVPNSDADPLDAALGARYYAGHVLADDGAAFKRVVFDERVRDIEKSVRLNDAIRRARASGHVEVHGYPCKQCKLFFDIQVMDGASRGHLTNTFKHGFTCTDCRQQNQVEAERKEVERRVAREAEVAANKERQRKKYGSLAFGDCPCGEGILVIRNSRNGGTFLGCTEFARGCRHSANIPTNDVSPEQIAEINRNVRLAPCPLCGGKVWKRNGCYGEFWGCSGWKQGCAYTANYAADVVTVADELVLSDGRYE